MPGDFGPCFTVEDMPEPQPSSEDHSLVASCRVSILLLPAVGYPFALLVQEFVKVNNSDAFIADLTNVNGSAALEAAWDKLSTDPTWWSELLADR